MPRRKTNPTSKLKELTLREKRLIKNLGDPKFKTDKERLEDAGYGKWAQRMGCQAIIDQKPQLKKSFRQILEETGVTDELLAKVSLDGLTCKRVVAAQVIKDGELEDEHDYIEVDDHGTRHRYLETAARFMGHGGGDGKPEDSEAPAPVKVIIEVKDARKRP